MDRGVPHWIFGWAARTPDKVAVIHDGKAFSYRDFAQRIAMARGYFATHGMVGEGIAIIAIRHAMNFWVVSLALRSLGVTVLGVGDAEAAAIAGVDDARCVVKSQHETWTGLQRLCGERGWPLLDLTSNGEPALDLDPDKVIVQPGGHIAQTSGTTGVFKKVLFDPSFEEVCLAARGTLRGVGPDSLDCLFTYPPWTGIGYKDTAAAWLLGAGVIFWQEAGPPHLALGVPGITHARMTPPILAAVLSAPDDAFPHSETLQVAIGAGTVTWSQIEQAKARISPHLFNFMGSTETNRIAFTRLDTPEDHRWHRPAPGRVVEIVDELDRPTPRGEVGRIRISTIDAPKAYFRDEETTRAFFKDGFFYPGDLAIMREDGRFALQGRVSDIINVQGFKASPAPVEDTFRQVLGVSGACLFTMQDDTAVEQLHLIIESASPIAVDSLAAVLDRECATWGFPAAHIHYLAALPRNPNGKLKRAEARQAAIDARREAGEDLLVEIATPEIVAARAKEQPRIDVDETMKAMGFPPDAAGASLAYEIRQPKDFAQVSSLAPIERPAEPLVSCLMVTRGDIQILRFAAECYRRQTWRNRELVVVTDPPRVAEVEAFLRAQGVEGVQMVDAGPGSTLGDCRNLSVARANGDILVQWDDDDLYDPVRLQTAVAMLTHTQAAAAFLWRWLIWWPRRRLAAISNTRIWEGSIAMWRENARVTPSLSRGEDAMTTRYLVNSQPVAMFDAPFQYIYTVTGENTWGQNHFEQMIWQATHRFEGADFDTLTKRLADRVPILEYAAALAAR